jgi:hypothetical protein
MHGYQEDEYGNFHPVDVPGEPDRRAQGPLSVGATGTTIDQNTVYHGPPTSGLAALGTVFGSNVPGSSIGTLSRGSKVSYLGDAGVLRADFLDSVTGIPTPDSWIARDAVSGNRTIRAADVFNGTSGSKIGNLSAGSSVSRIRSFDRASVTDAVTGISTPNVWIFDGVVRWSGQPAPSGVLGGTSTAGASQQTQAVLKAIGNGASVKSFPDGSIRVIGSMPGAPGSITWSIHQDGSGVLTPQGGSPNRFGPGTYQPNIILGASRKTFVRVGRPVPVSPPLSGVARPVQPTMSGVAAPAVVTPSGIPSATVYSAPAYYAPRRQRRPLTFRIPQVPIGGIDPAVLQLLLQEAQEQGAEDVVLKALIEQLQNGANFGPAVSGMGLNLVNLLQGAGVTLDAAGLPVPAGYVGTDQAGADLYADGGVDPTGGGLGDYTDPRSQ